MIIDLDSFLHTLLDCVTITKYVFQQCSVLVRPEIVMSDPQVHT